MTKYLITILLFSSCAAAAQTSTTTKMQNDISVLKTQVAALQKQVTDLINRMTSVEKQILIKDTVNVMGPNLILDSVSLHRKNLYFKQ